MDMESAKLALSSLTCQQIQILSEYQFPHLLNGNKLHSLPQLWHEKA